MRVAVGQRGYHTPETSLVFPGPACFSPPLGATLASRIRPWAPLRVNQTSRFWRNPVPALPIDQLKSSFRGELIQATDANYESARKVYNGMIDKRPQLISRCVDVADVIAAVNYARENNLLSAIRGGGHNGAGLGTCDGGIVIDLSRMKGVRVDPANKTVRAEGGCVWAMWITPLMLSAWRLHVASFPRRAWRASLSE